MFKVVICAGVQENGKLPTENEPKIGLSLQNVRTVKVEGFPSLFSTMAIVMIIEEEEKYYIVDACEAIGEWDARTFLTTQFHIPYIDDNDTNFSPQT
ncbi:hypothetical protein F2Q68_00037605 [Brassica cretica]|uniref:Uncharacterized protein n=1 Tax=Brassica cretica TaxID=69181 RepID=A0A8S9H3J8_BRACR|nr:hypothetical protein F2Q68_00037605 [Brassica cretica]